MAFTPKKRKNLEAAQKYAQKGQYDKALKEYQRLLKEDPKDANLRLRIGDLHLKLGEAPRAIEAYTQVAEEFSKGGFDAKAVAIYKQILRVNEDHLEARIALGDHFQRMGLKSDALREFQGAVELCQRRELKREAFDLLKRVASLDPSNVSNRLHLATLLQREGLEDEAREEYAALLADVSQHSDAEAIVRVAEQTLKAFPNHREALVAIVGARVSLGQPKEALEALERGTPHHGEDVELLEARIQVLEALEDSEAAQRAWRALAEAYKRRGDVEKARDILQRHCSPAALSRGEDTSSQSILLTDAAAEEDDVEDPEPAFDVSGPDVRSVAAASMSLDDMLAEARVSYEFGDPAEARKLARAVLKRDPAHSGARELLRVIEGGPPARRLDATPEFELDAPALEDRLGKIPDPSQSLPDIEIVLEDEADRDDAYASVEPPPELGEAPVEDEQEEQIEFEIEVEGLDAEVSSGDEARGDVAPDPALASRGRPEPRPAAAAPQPGPDASRIRESLEEAEFYLTQGMHAEAKQAYRAVLGEAPDHAQAKQRLAELERLAKPAAAPPPAKPAAPPAPAKPAASPKSPATAAKRTAAAAPSPSVPIPEIPDLDFTPLSTPHPLVPKALDFSEEDAEPLTNSVWELEPDAGSTSASGELVAQAEHTQDLPESFADLQESEPDAPAAAEATRFDPSELLDGADEIFAEDPPEPEAPEASAQPPLREEDMFDLAAELEDFEQSGGLGGSDRPRFGFDEVFRDFKRGIQQQIGEGDADAHYDLAIAYKEMGLLEDALRELAIVQRQGSRRVETLSLMATCKLELGRAQEAVTDLKGALQIATEPDLQRSLRYELAEALISAGKPAEALVQFKRVAAEDAAYRDVQDRIAELE